MTTEERKAVVNAEIKSVIDWFVSETNRIYAELNERQGAKRKFDGGNKPYAEVHKEFAQRMNAIGKKYGLLTEEAQ
ncbi:MAG: hypothetical protein SR1Q7_07455 [Quinella sp. 1Q7]|nr:hypothetical protein [Quinella sp. 1Q7]